MSLKLVSCQGNLMTNFFNYSFLNEIFSRPLHVFLITSFPFVLELAKPSYEDDRHLYLQICFVQQSCYVLLAALPAFWFLGWLPPVEPLIFWLLEQIQVHLTNHVSCTQFLVLIFAGVFLRWNSSC